MTFIALIDTAVADITKSKEAVIVGIRVIFEFQIMSDGVD